MLTATLASHQEREGMLSSQPPWLHILLRFEPHLSEARIEAYDLSIYSLEADLKFEPGMARYDLFDFQQMTRRTPSTDLKDSVVQVIQIIGKRIKQKVHGTQRSKKQAAFARSVAKFIDGRKY